MRIAVHGDSLREQKLKLATFNALVGWTSGPSTDEVSKDSDAVPNLPAY